jgi:predicted RNA-binding Zn ribbon-like protein
MNIGEDELLALLNSAPIIDGEVIEQLDDASLRVVRDELQSVIRGTAQPARLDRFLKGVSQKPRLDAGGIAWAIDGPASTLPSARYVIAWSAVERDLPGRLRPCANHECSKFLIDHSKPNSARWCSMAECGNRMKARRHHARQTQTAGDGA